MQIPPEASNALNILQKRLPESLLAMYLHGSAVSSGLRLHSDVDLLAVVSTPIKDETRKHLVTDLMRISGRYPFDLAGRRPLELIAFTVSQLSMPSYPTRCDFIYGEWLRQGYEKGEFPSPVADPEFTIVLAQARQEAKVLFGPDADAKNLLPIIAQTDIRRAIGDALPALVERLLGDERNVLLTLARMWRTLVTGEFVSKDAAAAWAAKRLSDEHAMVLVDAQEAYLGLCIDNWQSRKQEVQGTVRALHDYVLQNL